MQSMTGFAVREGRDAALIWRWELRSVNSRGLDLRWRGPEGREAVEAKFRAAAEARLTRGAVTASLKLTRLPGATALSVDAAALSAILDALRQIGDAAREAGLEVAPLRAEALLARLGPADRAEAEPDPVRRVAQDAEILADGELALDDLLAARLSEGAQLAQVLHAQVDRIAALTEAAEAAAARRAEAAGPALVRKLKALAEAGAPADPAPDRLAQELALLAVKADVREELDRLRAHLAAARALLTGEGPRGRKLDFLVQEFNREANTLCAKADFTELTHIGLELKTVIDQLREQAQNVE